MKRLLIAVAKSRFFFTSVNVGVGISFKIGQSGFYRQY